jgi:hypothetical protein
MILLDWTRMGRSYCLAGVVADRGGYRVVRPLLARYRGIADRKLGWSAFLLDRHSRWEIFELIGPTPAVLEPPHLEDLWVKAMQPRRRLAPPEQRRQILAATTVGSAEPLFGEPLQATRAAAFLNPGTGRRSLVTLVVPRERLSFNGCWREGHPEPDVRVTLPIPDLGERQATLKDHHLLARAEQAAPDLPSRLEHVRRVVAQMGDRVAVRLGLSRPFTGGAAGQGQCWLMVDGLFSLADPQP